MFNNFTDIANATDHELLVSIAMFSGGLFVMRCCQWVYNACKWLHDWLSSMFPTSIDSK